MVNHVITVTDPSKNSLWIKGSSYEIKWTTNFGGNVNIELHKKLPNGTTEFYGTLASGFSVWIGVNTFNWNISPSVPNGEYKIVIKK